MKKLSILGLFLLASSAQAYVEVSPLLYDFGNVPAGLTRTTVVTFTNHSQQVLNSFTVYCSGDLSVYRCSSSCFRLQPWGSCRAYVEFSPRTGDNRRHTISVEGRGSGQFANSRMYGVDADENRFQKTERKYFWPAYATEILMKGVVISPWKVEQH